MKPSSEDYPRLFEDLVTPNLYESLNSGEDPSEQLHYLCSVVENAHEDHFLSIKTTCFLGYFVDSSYWIQSFD